MLNIWRSQHVRSFTAYQPVARLTRIRARTLLTLAIESSCDDTSVAILEKHDGDVSEGKARAELHFHQKVTSDNRQFQGVSPIQAVESHQENLGRLVQKSLASYRSRHDKVFRPDFISVTRGPGMRSSINAGLDFAKGLAVAYGVSLVGVNHMQAHALTPRLVAALQSNSAIQQPTFPFLTLLVSGGHTMLLLSKSLTTHQILASTSDVALGDALDKMAREILPDHIVQAAKDVSYARDLESFVASSTTKPVYSPPRTREQETQRKETKWGWSMPIPFAELRGGQKARAMELSFTGLNSAVHRLIASREPESLSDEERVDIGFECMRIAFEHVASRTVFALNLLKEEAERSASENKTKAKLPVDTLVVSGGVAANHLLRVVFAKYLEAKGHPEIRMSFPPIEFCTDNAAMIAYAGMEMYEAGWESDLSIRSVRKWSLDPSADDGGILGLSGWRRRPAMKEASQNPISNITS